MVYGLVAAGRLVNGPVMAGPDCKVSLIALVGPPKSFDTVAFFDFRMREAWFAFVAHTGFNQIEIIVQVFQFFA